MASCELTGASFFSHDQNGNLKLANVTDFTVGLDDKKLDRSSDIIYVNNNEISP